jgi:integrase
MIKKRATADEPIFNDERLMPHLENLATKIIWPYKSQMKKVLQTRDKALFAFLLLTGCRASEAVQIKRSQIVDYKTHIEVLNISTLKHGNVRLKVYLPKKGRLNTLTLLVSAWIKYVEQPNDYLWPTAKGCVLNYNKPIERKRVYQIIRQTGLFPHWCRAVCETVYGRQVFKNDPYKLMRFMGIRSINNILPYVQASWEENIKDIYKL